MDFGHELIYCLSVNRDTDIVSVPINDNLKKGDADGNDMYETSKQCDDSVFANSYFGRFVQSFASDVTQRSASMYDEIESQSTED